MIDVFGSICVFLGGGMVWWRLMSERRQKRELLMDLLCALRHMREEIRLTRTPLPLLLEVQAGNCRSAEAAILLCRTASAARQGEHLQKSWREAVACLPLAKQEQALFLELEWVGDEESICNAIYLVTLELQKKIEGLEQQRPEEVKRTTALCFSAAALLVILLI